MKKTQRKKLVYKQNTSYKTRFSTNKKDRMGFFLRQVRSYSRILKELKNSAGEFGIYKNRIRDCEYEIYKIRKLLKEKGLADYKFLNDALK